MRSAGAARDARQYGDTRPGRLGAAEQVPGTGAVLGGDPGSEEPCASCRGRKPGGTWALIPTSLGRPSRSPAY